MRFRLRSGQALGYATRGAGVPVVLLHPIGLNRHFWDPVIAHLEADVLTIAIDLAGHGDSDVTDGAFTIGSLANDCTKLVAALAGSAVVVGCSMGASVAQLMAADHPSTVRSLVLANTSGPRQPGRTNTIGQRAQEALAGMPAIADATLERWFSRAFRQANPHRVEEIRQMLLAEDPFVHARAWRALSARPDDHYERISCPVLTIAGTEDPGASPAAVRRLAAAIKNAKYQELAGAGHLAPVEQPQAFASAVRTFVQAGLT